MYRVLVNLLLAKEQYLPVSHCEVVEPHGLLINHQRSGYVTDGDIIQKFL